MLLDSHCHLNMMVKKEFDRLLTEQEIENTHAIIEQAAHNNVTTIINVGTSLSESINCVKIAQHYPQVYASVGLHPNDCTADWMNDLKEITKLVTHKQLNKIVAIGECGIDRHYPDYNLQRQRDAFRAQIELALEHNLALIVHSRDAYDETLAALDEFKNDPLRGTIHCFSEDQAFADHALNLGFVLGIGATITYPKNNVLREVVKKVPLEKIILETDAPFLPPQEFRGKQNSPSHIATIAHYLAELRGTSFEQVAQTTTETAYALFALDALNA